MLNQLPRFIPNNYDQSSMIVINFNDQLQPGTFEHALHHLVTDRLDLSVFYPQYKNSTTGRLAYDPAVLIKIILFAYSKGIKTSREIQWCCDTNIIFKALSCDTTPHWTTIAKFVSSMPEAIEALFEQVLLVCDEDGLLGKELFAIDGCKMSSNAAKEWSGTHKELAKKRAKIKRQIKYHLAEHKRMDLADADGQAREQRAEQAIETLTNAHDKIDRFLKSESPRMGQGKRPKEVKSNITDNESCKMMTPKGAIQGYNGVATADKKHQIIVDAQAFGEGQEHHTLEPVLEVTRDRLKRLGIRKDIFKGRYKPVITADTGFANETNMRYLHENKVNAYIPDNRFRERDPKFADHKAKYGKRHPKPKRDRQKDVIPASEFQFDPVNMTCICPAGKTLSPRGVKVTDTGLPKAYFEGRLLDCRNCDKKHECMRNPDAANHRKGNGRQVSFVLEHKRKPNFTDWMKHRVDSEYGKLVYSHRMSVVEPVFGNIGTNKRLNRFSLRGKRKVQGQWQLYCMVHNIEKIMRYGKMAA